MSDVVHLWRRSTEDASYAWCRETADPASFVFSVEATTCLECLGALASTKERAQRAEDRLASLLKERAP